MKSWTIICGSRQDEEEEVCWILKRAEERSRAGRWSRAQKVGQPFASVVHQQLCYGHCLCDSAPHSSWNSSEQSTQVASHWWGPHCLNIDVVLAVVHGLFSLCSLECVDELFTLSPFPPFSPSQISHRISVDIKQHVCLLTCICQVLMAAWS